MPSGYRIRVTWSTNIKDCYLIFVSGLFWTKVKFRMSLEEFVVMQSHYIFNLLTRAALLSVLSLSSNIFCSLLNFLSCAKNKSFLESEYITFNQPKTSQWPQQREESEQNVNNSQNKLSQFSFHPLNMEI